MKKLVVLFSVSVIICFAATFIGAQNNDNDVTVIVTEESSTKCSLFFGQVLNGSDKHLDHFKDNVEYFLETGFFWEACLTKQLQNGQNITLNYIGHTQGVQPNKTELKNLLKSAIEFKDELEDYIEEQEPKTSPLYWAERYIALQVSPKIMLDKTMRKMLNRENKKFDTVSANGKIYINIMTEQDEQNAGDVTIRVK